MLILVIKNKCLNGHNLILWALKDPDLTCKDIGFSTRYMCLLIECACMHVMSAEIRIRRFVTFIVFNYSKLSLMCVSVCGLVCMRAYAWIWMQVSGYTHIFFANMYIFLLKKYLIFKKIYFSTFNDIYFSTFNDI